MEHCPQTGSWPWPRAGKWLISPSFRRTDGTWQLWGCIRGVNVSEGKRLLYRWESRAITDTNWTPKGIGLLPDTNVGEKMVQSPYCFKEDGLFSMFYSDFDTPQICRQTSKDGKHFTRLLTNGKVGLWAMSQTDQCHARSDGHQNRRFIPLLLHGAPQE